jgi:hypothetical protein
MVPEFVLLIPLVSVVLGISLAMLALYLNYRKKTEALRLAHAERMAAIEKGIELPPPTVRPLQVDAYTVRHGSRLRTSGLVLLFVGAAITVAMWQSGADGFLWGLVPAAIGAAQLVSSLLETREPRVPGPPGPGERPPEA